MPFEAQWSAENSWPNATVSRGTTAVPFDTPATGGFKRDSRRATREKPRPSIHVNQTATKTFAVADRTERLTSSGPIRNNSYRQGIKWRY